MELHDAPAPDRRRAPLSEGDRTLATDHDHAPRGRRLPAPGSADMTGAGITVQIG
ncbi:hypothetical protein MOV08_01050 [Streptomyces yunnanensis]|uniref:Uncharacterized protein n=1 Tax=Streptomyces yunnanensis TaxID=156453 RepID=A0ABY8A2K3_9ACTN|nr:hypothetical protein [Streptomyces yunnanensis]WEB38036.1 hypothetical protein MOV08_01050 [Streptomyces yunnanensis]